MISCGRNLSVIISTSLREFTALLTCNRKFSLSMITLQFISHDYNLSRWLKIIIRRINNIFKMKIQIEIANLRINYLFQTWKIQKPIFWLSEDFKITIILISILIIYCWCVLRMNVLFFFKSCCLPKHLYFNLFYESLTNNNSKIENSNYWNSHLILWHIEYSFSWQYTLYIPREKIQYDTISIYTISAKFSQFWISKS